MGYIAGGGIKMLKIDEMLGISDESLEAIIHPTVNIPLSDEDIWGEPQTDCENYETQKDF